MTKPHHPNNAAPMTRQQFLKLAAAAGGVLAADGLLGPLNKAFAQAPVYNPAVTAKPVQTRPIPSSGEQLPIIGMGTAVVYEIETSDPKFPALVEIGAHLPARRRQADRHRADLRPGGRKSRRDLQAHRPA